MGYEKVLRIMTSYPFAVEDLNKLKKIKRR